MRFFTVILLLAFVPFVQAQTVRSYTPPSQSKPVHKPRQPHDSMARGTTPFNCQQYRNHPHPGMHGFCEGTEYMVIQQEAKRQGRPVASERVINLPALGTAEAKELGSACVGGQAFRKLPNGWEQVMAPAGGWQRCRGG